MDELPWAVIIGLIISIIILIIAGLLFSNTFTQSSSTTTTTITTAEQEQLLTITRPPIQWSPNEPSTTPVRNTCQLYIFPARMEGNFAILGEPTFNLNTINNLPPGGPPEGCVDIDQLALQQFTRTCIQSQCQGSDGKIYTSGEKETYYGLCGTGSSKCNDVLGLISVGFKPTPFPPTSSDIPVNCFAVNTTRNIVTQDCNLGNTSQLLRVFRYNTGGQTINNTSGPYAVIIHRETELAIAPINVTASEPNTSPNTELTLVNPSTLPNNGIIWWLFGGGIRLALVSINNPNEELEVDFDPSGNPIVLPGYKLTTTRLPAQLVYWSDINSTPPSTNRELNLFLRQFRGQLFSVQNQGLQNPVLLQPFALNDTSSEDDERAQLLSYSIYNLIVASSAEFKQW